MKIVQKRDETLLIVGRIPLPVGRDAPEQLVDPFQFHHP